MTWAELLAQIVAAYELLGETNPELVATEVAPGAQVDFMVSVTDIGSVTVPVKVPMPLVPPDGMMTVTFRDVVTTDVVVPLPGPPLESPEPPPESPPEEPQVPDPGQPGPGA